MGEVCCVFFPLGGRFCDTGLHVRALVEGWVSGDFGCTDYS